MDAHLSKTYFDVPFLVCLSVNDVFLADIAMPKGRARAEGAEAQFISEMRPTETRGVCVCGV